MVNMSRPWDLLFPPESIYKRRSSFDVGTNQVFGLVYAGDVVIAAYVIAMRDRDSCLMDVRCTEGAGNDWPDHMMDHWEQVATASDATTMTGPVGAFPFLTDGVSLEDATQVKSIHIPTYPHIIVDSFVRRGYVHAWSGTIWGRGESVANPPTDEPPRQPGVRVGTWMNVVSTARKLERVLSASFSTLPWHRGSGATLGALARGYFAVCTPSLVLLGEAQAETVGAVLMYRDMTQIPKTVHSWPRIIQETWLWFAALRSKSVHVSVIGLLPKARNSRTGAALFAATKDVLSRADHVTTSWIRDDNRPSRMMAMRVGLEPIQQRTVFRKVISTISNN
jgi:hypothetical protein